MWRKKILVLLLINLIFLAIGCGYPAFIEEVNDNKTSSFDESNNVEEANTITVANNENLGVNENELKDFIIKFMVAIKNGDSKTFKELIDKDGIFSITYFIDQRDPNVAIHVFKDEIRNDLVLVNSENTVGITIGSMFAGNAELQQNDIPINISQNLSDISFNIDWHNTDESVIEKRIEDIIKTCHKINLTNNEYIPQVFVLKDNIYAFAYSSVMLGPELDVTGDWAIFEKIDSEYKLRAVMRLL